MNPLSNLNRTVVVNSMLCINKQRCAEAIAVLKMKLTCWFVVCNVSVAHTATVHWHEYRAD